LCRFQWVVCQLETLRRSVQPDVRGILETLPKTLDETYERVLKDIDENNREHVRRLLHCLSVAIRPLRVEELAEILAFDCDAVQGRIPTFEAGRRPENPEEAVLSACSSLIAIVNDGDCRVVQFSHLSVKEFLTSNYLASSTGDLSKFHILPRSAHTIFAQVCLGFLLQLEDHIDHESCKNFPLARYAAQYWVTHAQFEDVASSLEDGMISLFHADKPHFATWVKTYDLDRQSDVKSQYEIPNPLYYAALCGFHNLVKHLAAKYPQHVNAIGGFYEFPLVAALYGKHFRVAEVLLELGGIVDVPGRGKETALHKMIRVNEEAIDAVQFLLERGADVNALREDLWTPLHLAVEIGELNIARVLLDHHADVNSQTDEGLTPLYLLSRQDISTLNDNGSTLAMLLLESGANVNLPAKDKTTPLHLASFNKRLEIVLVLLEHGANAEAENDDGRTPLQESVRGERHFPKDRASVARLLLERGAEAYGRDKYHVTASDLAFCFGNEKVSQVLFSKPEPDNNRDQTEFHIWLTGERVLLLRVHSFGVTHRLFCAAAGNVRDMYDTILLHSASYYGRLEMAQVLLDNDIQVDAKNHRGETALHVVSRSKDNSQEGVRLAQLLLERGGDVHRKDGDHRTPLHAASYYARPDIAQVLLDHGANVNAENTFRRAPLHLVTCGDYEAQESGVRIAKLLLEHGADVNAPDKYRWSPLHLASHNERPEIVQVLLDHGANANILTDLSAAPLHVLSQGKRPQDGARIAQLLLDHGADSSPLGNSHRTPLHELSFYGKLDIVRVLLEHGAKANAQDSFLRTPLHAVSQGEYESKEDGVCIAQLLLERGVDVNVRDKNRETPLHSASASGRVEIVRVLLDHVTATNGEGQTPSHLGIESEYLPQNYPRVADIFSERDVHVNAERHDNQTPLHLASHCGKPEVARLLLDHGANANAKDNLFKTPLHRVAGGHYQSQEDGAHIARLLLEHGADINPHDVNRETPLHSASAFGRLEIARMLLEHAAMKNDQGQDPPHLGSEGEYYTPK
jgi:ankyrin repeat protein